MSPTPTLTPTTEPAATAAAAPLVSLIGGDPTAATEPAAEAAAPAESLAWTDLELPAELASVPEEQQTLFLGLLNNPELASDRKAFAREALTVHNQLLENAAAEMAREFESTQAAWQDQVRALPEFAGDRFEPAFGEIAKLVNRYGDKDFREAMNLTGVGNHPAMARFLLKIAKDVNEAKPISGSPPVSARSTHTQRLYGNQQ